MGFLDRLEIRNDSNTISSPAELEELLRLGSNVTAAGRRVTPRSALGSSPVWAAIELLAGSISGMPVHMYRRLDNDGKEIVKPNEHRVARLVSQRPNKTQDSVRWRRYMQLNRGANGKCYAFINRGRGGRVLELVALPAAQVEKYVRGGSFVYRIDAASPLTGEFAPQEILEITWVDHIRYDGLIEGMGPVQACRESIGLGIEAARHAALMLQNGARGSGTLTYDGKIGNPEKIKSVRTQWNDAMGGDKNYGTAVLDGGWKYTPITMKAIDIQLIEQLKFSVEDAARMFGVPSAMIASTDQAIRANVEQQSLNYVVHHLMPHIEAWEAALTTQLLTEREQQEFFFEFNVDRLLRGDFKSRMQGYGFAIQHKIMNPNEVRVRENMNRYEGGDEYANPNVESRSADSQGLSDDTDRESE